MPIFLVSLVDASKVTTRPVAFAVRTRRPALVCVWLFDPHGGGGSGGDIAGIEGGRSYFQAITVM